MNLIDLIKRTRSYRRFDANFEISQQQLKEMIEHARLSASARNQQSLRYLLITQQEDRDKLFPMLRWAGYLKNWDGPNAAERPSAYVVVCHDKRISNNHFCDEGIAMQSIMLSATEQGLGGCIIAAFDKSELRNQFNIAADLEILNVLAIGKAIEKVVIEQMEGHDYEYWRDDKGVHHVPKRDINDILI